MDIHRITHSDAGVAVREPLADFPALVFCGEVYHIPSPPAQWHVQDEFEFVYIARGISSLEVGEKTFMVHPGQLTVTYPGERHRINGATDQRNQFLYVALDLPKLGAAGSSFALTLRRKRVRILNHAYEIESALRGLTRQVVRRAPGYKEVVRAHVQLILTLLAQLCQSQKPPRPAKRRPGKNISTPQDGPSIEVDSAIRFMQTQLDRKLPIKEIAQYAGWSPAYLYLRFRKEIGLSPHAYHLSLRLDAAKDALSLPDAPIISVAQTFGFSSSQHFSAAFAKSFGLSPTAWRTRHVKNGVARQTGVATDGNSTME